MTDPDLQAKISGDPALSALASAGHDVELVAALNTATLITFESLAGAAQQTLGLIASGANPMSEMEVIGARIREGDAAGIGTWASALLLLKKMPQAEHDAVNALVAAAVAPNIPREQVLRVLSAMNPPKRFQSAAGTPGSWHVQPNGSQFQLFWDGQPAPAPGLFSSVADAEAWQAQWYIDHPAVEVKS